MKGFLISGAVLVELFSPFIDSSASAAESVASNASSTLTIYPPAIEDKNVKDTKGIYVFFDMLVKICIIRMYNCNRENNSSDLFQTDTLRERDCVIVN